MGGYTSRDFPTRQHLAVVKSIEAACPNGSVQFYKLFEDFIVLGSITIQQSVQVMTRGEKCPELEAEYMEIIKRHDPKHTHHFAEAFQHLVSALEGEQQATDGAFYGGDVLGEIFMACELGNEWRGQFFTPWCLCQAMAKFTLGDRPPDRMSRMLVNEPCIGGGAMLLALASELRTQNYQPFHWWFDATDIDYRCFHMAYLQLSLCGCPGVVRRGDTLRMEFNKAWLTPTGAMFPLRQRDLAKMRGEDAPAPENPVEVIREFLALDAMATANPRPKPSSKRGDGRNAMTAKQTEPEQQELSLL